MQSREREKKRETHLTALWEEVSRESFPVEMFLELLEGEQKFFT